MGGAQTTHRYPRRAIRRAVVLAALVGAVAIAAAAATGWDSTVSVICVTLVLACCAYAARTLVRGAGTIVLDERGLRVAGVVQRAISWNDLTRVRLAYYTTRRDGENGWMELSLRGGGSRITLDSEIDGFADIAARSLEAARERDLDLSDTTRRNFDAALAGVFDNGRLVLRRAGSGAGNLT